MNFCGFGLFPFVSPNSCLGFVWTRKIPHIEMRETESASGEKGTMKVFAVDGKVGEGCQFW